MTAEDERHLRSATELTPLDQAFDAGSLYALRAAVTAHAAAAGLGRFQVYDVTAVAHELAANAVTHGAGHGRLRLWSDDKFLYCQVSDDGRGGPVDGTDGTDGATSWPAEHGHGLWLTRQIADHVSLSHGPAGTTATVRFPLSSG